MNEIGKPERSTQDRVVRLFRETLGYRYLGNWEERDNNSNIEEALLRNWLEGRGYPEAQISQAIEKLRRRADKGGRDLYHINQDVYHLLRYGADVLVGAGENHEKVNLVDWANPEANDFAIAEEVTLRGGYERRPDLVLYINGLAVGVIELKNSRVSIGDGIRQLNSNQRREFNEWFFSTVQLLFAGSDSEGLQYGTIGTEEKYFLKWKEDEDADEGYPLDKYLSRICRKDRLVELMHDFILFDAGIKKVPRVHQYFGVKAAQEHVRRKEGGIIWHTQGSGKSIVMVLLAQWILENNPRARVAIVTDRDELDKQIEGVLKGAGIVPENEKVRTTSGKDLMAKLSRAKPRLICSLIHKFGPRNQADFDGFIKEIQSRPSKTVGDVFVFVDECHRTQSGKLNEAMKAILPDAVFIGFTGTPLLQKDKKTTMEVFGGYIHTYKFSEAVDDKVVLDLLYEARDIDQELGSKDKVDAWFDAKTRGLNDWQKDELKKKWGTLQKVLSSKSRMQQIVNDITFDFSTKPRLSNHRGNAILVAKSIFEACRFFELFNAKGADLHGHCAIVTSYNPNANDVSREDTGASTETERQFIHRIYQDLLENVVPLPNQSKTKTYEDAAKKAFIKEPARMKLLIVVDKLLTGFDAPPCTYLYIDKSMQDHGLFQAICRTNRLHGEDKEFGHIIDYMDLFKQVEDAIAVYSSALDRDTGGPSPDVLMKNRLKQGRERLDNALEKLEQLCEPVDPPREELEYIRYFCGNSENTHDLEDREPQRSQLYQGTASLVRAYANISDELKAAGYSESEQAHIEARQNFFIKLRDTVKHASGEFLDTKAYEADMRHLIDHYIKAEEPRKISHFEDVSLVELIVRSGIAETILEAKETKRKEAAAETIENNIRKKIIRESLNNPAFFEKMSLLLDEVIADRKHKAVEYERYLDQIQEIARKVEIGYADDAPQALKKNKAVRAIYDNLHPILGRQAAEGQAPYSSDRLLELAKQIDEKVRVVKPDAFRGNPVKERVIMAAILPLMDNDEEAVRRMFEVIKRQTEY